MDRDQLIAEIKKQLQEEMKAIPDHHQEQFKEIKNTMTEQMKQHPWTAVGLAALTGFVLARLIYKRSED